MHFSAYRKFDTKNSKQLKTPSCFKGDQTLVRDREMFEVEVLSFWLRKYDWV